MSPARAGHVGIREDLLGNGISPLHQSLPRPPLGHKHTSRLWTLSSSGPRGWGQPVKLYTMVPASRRRFDGSSGPGHSLSFLMPASHTSGCPREHSESLPVVSQGWGIGQSPDMDQEHRTGTNEGCFPYLRLGTRGSFCSCLTHPAASHLEVPPAGSTW